MTKREIDKLQQRVDGYVGTSFEERLASYLPAYRQRINKEQDTLLRYKMRVKYSEMKELLKTLRNE